MSWRDRVARSDGDEGIESRLMDTGKVWGERSGWEEWREQHGNIYTTVCKMDSWWEFAAWLRELTLGLCDNLEGWERVGGRSKREGSYVHLWLIHVDVWQNSNQYCNYPSIKNKYIKKNCCLKWLPVPTCDHPPLYKACRFPIFYYKTFLGADHLTN